MGKLKRCLRGNCRKTPGAAAVRERLLIVNGIDTYVKKLELVECVINKLKLFFWVVMVCGCIVGGH